MTDLSILIPSRNEQFLRNTIDDILKNSQETTEIIAILDGQWAEPPIPDHPRVTLIYHSESIGQRAAINEAAKLSSAKYVMKIDAHCALDKGFDAKLITSAEELGKDVTQVPRQYNLHVFNWRCNKCSNETYQGPTPTKCKKCDNTNDFERVMVWQPRWNRVADFMRFDTNLKFAYWGAYKTRPEAQGDIADLMSCIGACWFMHRDRYWELGGLDEEFGSWGQVGTELACKSVLSGGRMVVNKKTFFGHMFRTQGAGFGFPYPLSGNQVERARQRSKDLFLNNKWEKQIYPLSWLIEKFAPIIDWHDESGKAILAQVMEAGAAFKARRVEPIAISQTANSPTVGIVWYTDNRLDPRIMTACQQQLLNSVNGHRIVSVSLQPLEFGENIHLPLERGYLTLFRQILAGLEASTADVIFLAEHDCLYPPEHFEFIPPRKDVYYYNINVWKVDAIIGRALHYDCKQTSGLCAYRDLLLQHYRERVRRTEAAFVQWGDSHEYRRWIRHQGFEPGTHNRNERVDDYKAESWQSAVPIIDIRHDKNLTPSRWRKDQFRHQRYCQGWQEADEVPNWSKLDQILSEVK